MTNGKLSGGIQGSKLSDFTLTSNLYAPQSVDGAAMKLRSVSTQIIGLGAVQSENIAAGSVQSDQIDTAAVDGLIHVSPGSLITQNYLANSVDQSALAPANVGTIQMQNNAITTSKVLAGQRTHPCQCRS